MYNNMLSSSELTKILTPSKKNPEYIHAREGKTIEFKESYNHGSMAQYFKTMASYANADGGYIIFGIGDSPRKYLGLSQKSLKQFENIKIEEFTLNLNEYFQPEINWEHALFEFKEKYYGIIYTYPLENKPCICAKMYDSKNEKYSLKEGDIYYRYRARSQKIRYSELKAIFDYKAEVETKKWIKLIESTAKIGISNASILDVETGNFQAGGSTIVLDEKILDKIKFVKEGKFVEKDGAPTLRVIGDIKDIKSSNITVPILKLKAIEQEDVVNIFLKNKEVEEPFEFIRSILGLTSGYQPIYYYIKKTGRSIDTVIDYIESMSINSQTTDLLLERLNGRREKFVLIKNNETEASSNKIRYLKMWEEMSISNSISEFDDFKKLNWALQAFSGLDSKTILSNEKKVKEIFYYLYSLYYKKIKGNISGNFRKALCRLDEVLYFE